MEQPTLWGHLDPKSFGTLAEGPGGVIVVDKLPPVPERNGTRPHTTLHTPTLKRIIRDDPDGPTLMGLAMGRVKQMSTRLGGGSKLHDMLWYYFSQHSPAIGIWLFLEGTTVVGHMVTTISEWNSYPTAWVHHVDVDYPCETQIKDLTCDAMDQWVRDYNVYLNSQGITHPITTLTMSSHRGAESKVWARHGGFTEKCTIFERKVPE